MSEERITVYLLRPTDRPNLQLQWVDPQTGERVTRSARTADEQEAERKRADKEYELNHGLAREPSRTTWQEFRAALEAEYLPGRRANTRSNYKATLGHFEAICQPGKMASITTRTASAFVAGLRSQGMKASTVAVRVECLRAALRWAVEQGMLAQVPAFPEVPVPKKKPQPVPEELFDRLLTKVEDLQTRAFLLCAWLAGLRRDEAFFLRWTPSEEAPWVDLTRNRIVFPAEACKGAEDQWVPLDAQLRAALETLPRPDSGRVFDFRRWDGAPLSSRGLYSRVADLCHKAGVRLTMRVLRRGFGSRYAARVPAQVLQRLMRHSDIEITLTYYASLDAALEAAVLGERHNALPNAGPEIAQKPSETAL